jgi:hypothetical protein
MAWCFFRKDYSVRWIISMLGDPMVQSPWEADGHSSSQEILHLLWNPNVPCHVHNSPPLVPVLSQLQPVYRFQPNFTTIHSYIGSRDSSVGIATRLRAGRSGFDSRGGGLFTTVSRTALGPTQPPIHWVPGALSLGVKRPGRDADHSPPSSAEVKNTWSYTSTPPIRLRAVVLS